MTATVDHTQAAQTPLQAAQERLEAALEAQEQVGRELQGVPALEQQAIRAGDEDALLRLGARRKILEQRNHEAHVARALAAYRLAEARSNEERARERALSQKLEDAFTAQTAAERAL